MDCGRKLVVPTKDVYLLEAASFATDLVRASAEDEVIPLYREPKRLERWEQEVYAKKYTTLNKSHCLRPMHSLAPERQLHLAY